MALYDTCYLPMGKRLFPTSMLCACKDLTLLCKFSCWGEWYKSRNLKIRPISDIQLHFGPVENWDLAPFTSLKTQNLNFIAPIPGQIGTTTMYFPWGVMRRIRVLKVARIKVGRTRPNRLSKSHVMSMGKIQPQIHVFQCILYKE